MSQTRINCSSGSTPAHTLRFEEASQKWLIITAQKNATGPCVLSRQIVDNVTFFSSSQVAVYQNELFRKYIPGKKLGAELVAAVCKPLSDHLDIGQSRLAGLVIYWNQIDRRWQTRLDYHLLTESDHLTNVGPIGVWQKEDSFLLFNTSRVNSKREPAASQRQKMNLEISRPQNVNTSLTENIWPAVLNYTFKVYGNHVQEITDGPMNCWVSSRTPMPWT